MATKCSLGLLSRGTEIIPFGAGRRQIETDRLRRQSSGGDGVNNNTIRARHMQLAANVMELKVLASTLLKTKANELIDRIRCDCCVCLNTPIEVSSFSLNYYLFGAAHALFIIKLLSLWCSAHIIHY